MMTYVTAFIFYTLAMIGILLVGFVVYKKTFQVNAGENKGIIKVIDSLPIGNKKHLLIVKIKNEKFLIASGLEHTTFLARLDEQDSIKSINEKIITPEVVDNSALNEIYGEIAQAKKEPRFDDYINSNALNVPKEQKVQNIQNIQKQFRQLYEQDDVVEPRINKQINRKDRVRQLLNELGANTNNGGRNSY